MSYYITEYDINKTEGTEHAALEDSIMHKGFQVTAGSDILRGFISPINATVVEKLEAAGICITGKTKMEEFGATSLFDDNPQISSGAVSAVADGAADLALCNDYTGAIGAYAAANGLCYIHPTYGTVSRFGLIPAVSSMDQIGIVCKTPSDGNRILSIIRGNDPKDGAMLTDESFSEKQRKSANEGRERGAGVSRKPVVGIPVNVFEKEAHVASIDDLLNDHDMVDFELMHFDVFAQVMQILCCGELSGNISRYDGIKFGYRAQSFVGLQELYEKTRTESFGVNSKLAAIMGAAVLSQENYEKYYDKAMRVRRLINESLDFNKYDAIVLPAFASAASSLLAVQALPRLCGLPALTIGSGRHETGITLVSDRCCEDFLFSILNEESTQKTKRAKHTFYIDPVGL